MPTDDKAIIAIYRVRIYVEGIDDVNDGYRPQNQRSSTVFKPSQTATQEACNGWIIHIVLSHHVLNHDEIAHVFKVKSRHILPNF